MTGGKAKFGDRRLKGRVLFGWTGRRSRFVGAGMALALSSVVLGVGSNTSFAQAPIKFGPIVASKVGELDCNGESPVQKSIRAMTCTDIRGLASVSNANTWGGKFYDNGHYIGHDEPDVTFLSTNAGSGDSVTWTETLGSDPTALPTTTSPGSDVSHYFELSPAPWFSMAICDGNSYPQLPCTPQSDANAPACPNVNGCNPNLYPGAGSAFMEMQFYPPGEAPFIDSISCDNTHWCAALNIDSLECTYGFAQCNTSCEEPVNFAFIQTNGVPTGAPNPQSGSALKFIPNKHTLLMNPGDKVVTHMFNAPAPGGGKAFEVVIDDLTLHTSGYMQASAANGFQNTSIVTCSGTPFNFQPEYNTAKAGNVIPWAALQTNISTEFETGHFEACTSLTNPIPNFFDPADTGGAYDGCVGAYETGPEGAESTQALIDGFPSGDATCYLKGDTHPGYAGPSTSTPPNEVTGCQANTFQNGDLDFDGSPYWTEWPTSTSAGKYPASFVQSMPTSSGRQYAHLFFQTDVALSESTCTPSTLSGCTVPPAGPGNFYPYWSEAHSNGACVFEFGNVSSGVKDFGKEAQYGTNQFSKLGYPEFEGPLHSTACPSTV